MRLCVYSAVSNLRNEDWTLQCNKHGLKVKKPDSEENILNDLTYVKLKSRQDRSVENGGGWDGGTAGGAPGTFWNFLWWRCSTALFRSGLHRCRHLSQCMERRTEDQITLERRSQLGGKALVWWKREATFHTLQAPHEAGYAVDEHETSASFQVSKSRDVFPQACTACVFSTVYRVFTKSSPLGGSCN